MAKYANLAMVIVLISVYGLAFRALKEVGMAASFVATPHTPQGFFLFCGNCFYSFEGVATIVPLIAAMEDQTAVPRVLGTALAVILALQVGKKSTICDINLHRIKVGVDNRTIFRHRLCLFRSYNLV